MYVPPGTNLQVSQARYDEFRRMTAAAEKLAKSEKLGLWSPAEQN
jgi:endonuclease YncB( thermonuclease family)